MTGVTIYMEGGGNSTGQTKLRAGMNEFLRELREKVRNNQRKWRLVPCGNRQQAYEKFNNARGHAGENEIIVLLVDSEEPVAAPTPVEHLRMRPGWDLSGVNEDRVHLMVQTMETWIVADSNALAVYYGQGFRANALPSRPNLEKEDKTAVASALYRATERTKKGRYHKIRHAADLLARTDPTKVRARCPHCAQLFDALGAAIAAW